MSAFNSFIYGHPANEVQAAARDMLTTEYDNIQSESEESGELTLEYVITEKPPVKIVRDFFREVLASIKSEEERLFD